MADIMNIFKQIQTGLMDFDGTTYDASFLPNWQKNFCRDADRS